MPQPQASSSAKQGVIEPLEPKAAVQEMIQVVENKKRNLEKRKQKLEALKAKPEGELNEQQQEAVSHIGEVNGNIQYVEEILTRFREINLQVEKWIALETKKEKLANKRNKQSAAQVKIESSGAVQRDEPVGNGHGNDASAEVTPHSRGSVCETPLAAAEQPSATESVSAADAVQNVELKATTADVVAPAAEVVAQQTESPEREDAVGEEDGAAPKETVTFVNSAAEGIDVANGVQAHTDGRGAGRGPRRGGRPPYHGGPPRGDYGYGPRFDRPRRGGQFRGGPRGAPRGAPAFKPQAAGEAN